MLDDDKGDVVGTVVREVEEETGLHLNVNDLLDLTAFLHPSAGSRVFPSPGGCDEELGLFLYRGSVDKEIIKQLQGKETGLRDHGEQEKKVVVIGATNRKQDLDVYSKLVNIFWNVVYALTTAEFESKVSDLVVFLFLSILLICVRSCVQCFFYDGDD